MKILYLENVEVQLIGDQAYVYYEDTSDVLNIPGIEFADSCEEILIKEIEQINNASFTETITLFN